jgi:hypothetical protein
MSDTTTSLDRRCGPTDVARDCGCGCGYVTGTPAVTTDAAKPSVTATAIATGFLFLCVLSHSDPGLCLCLDRDLGHDLCLGPDPGHDLAPGPALYLCLCLRVLHDHALSALPHPQYSIVIVTAATAADPAVH